MLDSFIVLLLVNKPQPLGGFKSDNSLFWSLLVGDICEWRIDLPPEFSWRDKNNVHGKRPLRTSLALTGFLVFLTHILTVDFLLLHVLLKQPSHRLFLFTILFLLNRLSTPQL